MKIKILFTFLLMLGGHSALAVTLTTVDGTKVEVASQEIIDNIGNATHETGQIVVDKAMALPTGSVVFDNPRYRFQDREFRIHSSDVGIGTCALLGFKNSIWMSSNYADSVEQTGLVVYLSGRGEVVEAGNKTVKTLSIVECSNK